MSTQPGQRFVAIFPGYHTGKVAEAIGDDDALWRVRDHLTGGPGNTTSGLQPVAPRANAGHVHKSPAKYMELVRRLRDIGAIRLSADESWMLVEEKAECSFIYAASTQRGNPVMRYIALWRDVAACQNDELRRHFLATRAEKFELAKSAEQAGDRRGNDILIGRLLSEWQSNCRTSNSEQSIRAINSSNQFGAVNSGSELTAGIDCRELPTANCRPLQEQEQEQEQERRTEDHPEIAPRATPARLAAVKALDELAEQDASPPDDPLERWRSMPLDARVRIATGGITLQPDGCSEHLSEAERVATAVADKYRAELKLEGKTPTAGTHLRTATMRAALAVLDQPDPADRLDYATARADLAWMVEWFARHNPDRRKGNRDWLMDLLAVFGGGDHARSGLGNGRDAASVLNLNLNAARDFRAKQRGPTCNAPVSRAPQPEVHASREAEEAAIAESQRLIAETKTKLAAMRTGRP